VLVAMPRPRPPHLHRQVTRHGKAVWYVRVGKGPRTRIRAEFGTPEFDAEYQAAVTGAPRPNAKGGPAVPGRRSETKISYQNRNTWTLSI